MKLSVRWTDQDGKERRKEYDNQADAVKARDWLLNNGADDADIAVIRTIKPQPQVAEE